MSDIEVELSSQAINDNSSSSYNYVSHAVGYVAEEMPWLLYKGEDGPAK